MTHNVGVIPGPRTLGVALGVSLVVYCLSSSFIAILALTVAAILALFLTGAAVAGVAGSSDSSRRALARAALVVGGFGLGVLLAEAGLLALDGAGRLFGGRAQRFAAAFAFPSAWERREVSVPGATQAYFWHGHLHVHDADGFRTAAPYTPDSGAFRVAVLGDSYTYGYGIAVEDAHPSVLERLLRAQGPARVYNLAVPRYNAVDILEVARKWLPRLRPDLVVYGVCLNDLLPSHTRHLDHPAWAIPLPAFLVDPIADGTRAGKLASRQYGQLLNALGVRDDFLASLMHDLPSRLAAFRSALVELNALAARQSGIPATLMVLNGVPEPFDSDGWRLARTVESIARDAQLDVVPSGPFRKRFLASPVLDLKVSLWEGHPNALVHRAWAESLSEHVSSSPAFKRFLAERE